MVLKSEDNLLFLKKKTMGITIDKKDFMIVKTSYGYYTDNNGVMYPFSVEVSNTNGEDSWIEISWDDDTPKNIDDVESELLEMF
jgi:hypothetical protein